MRKRKRPHHRPRARRLEWALHTPAFGRPRWPVAPLLLAALATLLGPLLHNLDHGHDHVHTSHGVVPVGFTWSWGSDAEHRDPGEYGHYADTLRDQLGERDQSAHAKLPDGHVHRSHHAHPHDHDDAVGDGMEGASDPCGSGPRDPPSEPERDGNGRLPAQGHGRQALEHFQVAPIVQGTAVVVVLDGWEGDAELAATTPSSTTVVESERRPPCRGPPRV